MSPGDMAGIGIPAAKPSRRPAAWAVEGSSRPGKATLGTHAVSAPLCSCRCGRRVYDSYILRGASARVGDAVLARTGPCAVRLAMQLPAGEGGLLTALLRLIEAGPLFGHGCGPRRKAHATLENIVARSRCRTASPRGSELGPPLACSAERPVTPQGRRAAANAANGDMNGRI